MQRIDSISPPLSPPVAGFRSPQLPRRLRKLRHARRRFFAPAVCSADLDGCFQRNFNAGFQTQNQKTPPSPKKDLGLKWREYHGQNDWEGLLEPLDENLRREIVKYGDFVQAAYNAMDFNPESPEYGCCKYPDEASLLESAGLAGSGYRVTKHLYTNSKFPDWICKITPPAKRKLLRQRSWVGFVAICEDAAEIRRLGRRDVVIALRGSVTILEWLGILNHRLVTVDPSRRAKAGAGFWQLLVRKPPSGGPSMADDVVAEIQRLRELHAGEDMSVTATGHSMGAALAVLAAYKIGEDTGIPATVFSFGGPRVGNSALGKCLHRRGARVLRVVNSNDVITKVPGVVVNERWGCATWHYCHVGSELRVRTASSPYLKAQAQRDWNCSHDLEAYLHLVDGYHSSKCPFRSGAKRDILRLLLNQKNNVKLNELIDIGIGIDINIDIDIGIGIGIDIGSLPFADQNETSVGLDGRRMLLRQS